MSGWYEGKICIVTGGCAGLGLAISKAFLAEGANVYASDISDTALSSCVEQVPEPDRARLHPFKANSAELEQVDELFAEAVGKFGRVDVLVNNAGVNDKMEPVGNCDRGMWDKNILVNLTAPFVTMGAATRQMEKQELVKGGRGVILNVISAAGLHGYRAGSAYTASKHGLVGLTKNTAAYYGPKGIRCVAIMPGAMNTGMGHDASTYHPESLKLIGKVFATVQDHFEWNKLEEVAKTVMVLCSDGMGTVNGALVPTDGGWTTV